MFEPIFVVRVDNPVGPKISNIPRSIKYCLESPTSTQGARQQSYSPSVASDLSTALRFPADIRNKKYRLM